MTSATLARPDLSDDDWTVLKVTAKLHGYKLRGDSIVIEGVNADDVFLQTAIDLASRFNVKLTVSASQFRINKALVFPKIAQLMPQTIIVTR